MKPFFRLLLLLLLMLGAHPSSAVEEHLMMARVQHDFPEAMSLLQKTLGEHGYTLSRVQHIDKGLTASGFETDRYRIVFFGKPEEIRTWSERYPALIPYLPLMITVFSEGEDTLLVAADPLILSAIAPDPELTQQLLRWQRDFLSIMATMRRQ